MRDYKEQIDQLAGLMEEFKLSEATLNLSGFLVTFKRQGKSGAVSVVSESYSESSFDESLESIAEPETVAPKGNPVTSPMAGIYYVSSSPSTSPFVKVGETISAGQTVGLIEAMKVFNEIPSPYTGVVLEILVESGGLVQPGDVLLRVG